MTKRRISGYWKNLENVKRELMPIVRDLGKVPSEAYLRKIGRQDIASGISKHHGMNQINQAFGFEPRASRKELHDWNQFKSELQIVIDDLGDFPSEEYLRKIGKGYLGAAGRDHHGGMTQVRSRLGFESPKGFKYWQDKENIFKEAKLIIAKLKRLPSSSELTKAGHSSFVLAVSTYYGGFNQLRKDLGLDSYQVESGYWQDVDNLLNTYDEIIADFPDLGTRNKLIDKGYGGFVSAVDKYYGGLRSFVTHFDLPIGPKGKPDGFWLDVANVKRAFQEVIDDIGHFPSYAELLLRQQSQLSTASQYHGGLRKIAKLLGHETSLIAKDGHHCDSFQELIVDDNLYSHGIDHERGITLNLDDVNVVPDFILGPKNVIEVLMIDYRENMSSKVQQHYANRYKAKKVAYRKHGYIVCEVFPSDLLGKDRLSQKLREAIKQLPRNSKISSISSESIDLYGMENRTHPGHWRDIRNIEVAIKPLCIKLGGRMPTYNEFEDAGLGRVYAGINKFHGDTREVGRLLGYPVDDNVSHRPRGFWENNLDHVMVELKKLHKDLGRFPQAKEIQAYDSSLYYAICRYHGGLRKVKAQYARL